METKELKDMLPIDVRGFETDYEYIKIDSLTDKDEFTRIVEDMVDDESLCDYVLDCLFTRATKYQSDKLYHIYMNICDTVIESLENRARFVNEAYRKSKEQIFFNNK